MSLDSTISALPPASTLTGTELVAVDQGSTKQTTTSQIAGLVNASTITFTPSGAGAVARTVQAKERDTVAAADYTGYDPTGVADSTAAVAAALTAASGRRLLITGTPRLKGAGITISAAVTLIFDGSAADPTPTPPSYFIKDASMTVPAVTITGFGVVWEGGGVIAEAGNTSDGIAVRGRNFTGRNIKVTLCGNDGISIGVPGTNTNADFWYLERCVSFSNGRDGYHIESNNTGAPEANIGLAVSCEGSSNTRDGFRNEISVGCIFFNCNGDHNTGWGLRFSQCNQAVAIGGDFEFNTAGQARNDSTTSSSRFVNFNSVLSDAGTTTYQTHIATDKNIVVDSGAGAGSVRISAINDTGNANTPLEIQASTTKIIGSGVQIGAPTGGSIGSGTLNVAAGVSLNNSPLVGAKDTTISTGVGSIKMKSANPATNAAWVPITSADGTVYFVPGWTTNNP